MDLTGKRIVLTGAASGIGLALLKRIAQLDARILAVDIQHETLKQLVQGITQAPDCRADIRSLQADLTQPGDVDVVFSAAQEAFAGVDVFIANAGFAYYEDFGVADWVHLERIFALNVISPLYSLQKLQHQAGSQQSLFVLTASSMAHIAIPGYSVYAATKAALDRFAEGYQFDNKQVGRLMLVYPIATRTEFFEQAGRTVPVPFPSQSADWVAGAILRGIRQGRRKVYPSILFTVGRWLPFGMWIMRRFAQFNANRQLRAWRQQRGSQAEKEQTF